MARSNITPTQVAETGLNISDATYTTMTAGATNGVMVPYTANTKIILRNDSGGDAVYTFKVPQETKYSGKGVTVPDAAVTLATGKIMIYPLSSIFKQSDEKVYIDCDVAGKIAAIQL